MSEKMILLVVKDLGHVLGVVTRTSDEETELTVSDAVGEEFVFRNPGLGTDLVTVPGSELEVQTVDLVAEVLAEPQAYIFSEGSPAPGIGSVTVSVAASEIVVTVPNPPAEEVNVQVQIDDQLPSTGKILALSDPPELKLARNTPSGDHDVLVLASGYELLFAQESV